MCAGERGKAMEDGAVSVADLSWAEYEWLSCAFDGPEIFVEIPKIRARTLLVEIIPGALRQFRLMGEPSNLPMDSERVLINQMGARIRDLEGIDCSKTGRFLRHVARYGSMVEGTSRVGYYLGIDGFPVDDVLFDERKAFVKFAIRIFLGQWLWQNVLR
jgi:hypothetical protein